MTGASDFTSCLQLLLDLGQVVYSLEPCRLDDSSTVWKKIGFQKFTRQSLASGWKFKA